MIGIKRYRHKYLPIKLDNEALKETIFIATIVILTALAVVFLLLPERTEKVTYKEHIVKPGETVWDIASREYPNQHTGAKVYQIVEANGVRDGLIKPGQKLMIPAK